MVTGVQITSAFVKWRKGGLILAYQWKIPDPFLIPVSNTLLQKAEAERLTTNVNTDVINLEKITIW